MFDDYFIEAKGLYRCDGEEVRLVLEKSNIDLMFVGLSKDCKQRSVKLVLYKNQQIDLSFYQSSLPSELRKLFLLTEKYQAMIDKYEYFKLSRNLRALNQKALKQLKTLDEWMVKCTDCDWHYKKCYEHFTHRCLRFDGRIIDFPEALRECDKYVPIPVEV
jgi:hypothetical protein